MSLYIACNLVTTFNISTSILVISSFLHRDVPFLKVLLTQSRLSTAKSQCVLFKDGRLLTSGWYFYRCKNALATVKYDKKPVFLGNADDAKFQQCLKTRFSVVMLPGVARQPAMY